MGELLRDFLETWFCHGIARGEKSQGANSWQEEIGATSYSRECGKTLDLLSHRPLWNRHVKCPVLGADERIAFIAEVLESGIVRPNIHRKLELPDQAGAADERSNPPLHAVFRRVLWQPWA